MFYSIIILLENSTPFFQAISYLLNSLTIYLLATTIIHIINPDSSQGINFIFRFIVILLVFNLFGKKIVLLISTLGSLNYLLLSLTMALLIYYVYRKVDKVIYIKCHVCKGKKYRIKQGKPKLTACIQCGGQGKGRRGEVSNFT